MLFSALDSCYKRNRDSESVVLNSGQKMALRAFYFVRTLTEALTFYYINRFQRHLLAAVVNSWFEGPIQKHAKYVIHLISQFLSTVQSWSFLVLVDVRFPISFLPFPVSSFGIDTKIVGSFADVPSGRIADVNIKRTGKRYGNLFSRI